MLTVCPTILKSEKFDFIKDSIDNSTNIWFLDFLSIGKSVQYDLKKLLLENSNGTRFYYRDDGRGQKNKRA